MDKKSRSRVSLSVGTFCALVYVFLLFLSIFISLPQERILYVQIFEIFLPGFVWMSFGSFLWGLILSFAYGFLGAYAYQCIYRFCFKMEKNEENLDLGHNDNGQAM